VLNGLARLGALRGLGGLAQRRRLRRDDAAAIDRELQAFLQVARQSFVELQAAWDRADLPAMRLFVTDPLLAELREELQSRGEAPNRTEVLELRAKLLALEELHEAFVASVEFSGVIREQLGQAGQPFRELWLLAKPKAPPQAAQSPEPGWQLARVQSLS
jgi:predicted lipid-binding transport protein (Tim44 family)